MIIVNQIASPELTLEWLYQLYCRLQAYKVHVLLRKLLRQSLPHLCCWHHHTGYGRICSWRWCQIPPRQHLHCSSEEEHANHLNTGTEEKYMVITIENFSLLYWTQPETASFILLQLPPYFLKLIIMPRKTLQKFRKPKCCLTIKLTISIHQQIQFSGQISQEVEVIKDFNRK